MSNKNKHLSLDDRRIILSGITNNSSKKSIADTLGKDPSTIAKEINLHRQLKHKCTYIRDCSKFPKCPNKKFCSINCAEYIPFTCKCRDRSPGA